MVDAAQIKEHVEVVGSDGKHVGTVDHMEGSDRIKLTKKDRDAAGQHHFIPLAWVTAIEGDKVKLNRTAAQAKDEWGVEKVG